MDFRILGPLEVWSNGQTLDLGGQKQRALLAMLLLTANRVVARDRLIEALWEDQPPETAQKALQVYVSQLRKLLGRDRLVTKTPGYLVRVEPDELDLERFQHLSDEGKLDEALALWRGPALSDFAYQRFAQTEIARLEELHLVCIENRIERDLGHGVHAELVGELEALVQDHPLRERLRGQLMLALYRSGRQAEALDAYQQARHALVDELGIEPGRSLRDLHQAILNQDAALDVERIEAPPSPAEPATPIPATRLPTGTVTLLFADVEGSTRLVYMLGGERYRDVRARARVLIRAAAAKHRGYEVDWAGDGVFLAFERARDSTAAAVELQRALAAEPWAPEEALRMRIGIHTGEPEWSDEGYVGLDVHVAARICSAAHGGQIVVSRPTRDFVGEESEPGITFRPLGSHRLRDVTTPQPLFQLIAPGIEEDFPPLQTLAGATLPALHHRLVGRSRAFEEINALIARPDVRLVTITGPGGAGKSRLALEVAGAAAVERPVHLVGLAPISDPDLVPAAIARTLGVRESPGRSLVESLAEALADTRALLFLDNLEHLTLAATHVAELLHQAPGIDVLTTSRAPLRLSGEHIVPLPPLDVEDAATFFFELAAARGVVLREDARSSVYEICRRLDGLPLAIELVAARLAVLPPARILQALDEGLALQMEGPVDLPERQRTLRATIDWSYDLLHQSQRELLGTLAVFAGGCTLDDARAVARVGASFLGDLEALVGWSLVRSDVSDGDVRLSMLETVRENTAARLAQEGKLDELRERHAERFLELAAAAEGALAGPEQVRWLERLELELDNIRLSLDWCLASSRVEDALRAASALGRFWRAHGHIAEARRWLAGALEQADGVSPDVRANALWWSARQAAAQDDLKAEVPLLEAALALFRELDRQREIAFVLGELGWIALQRGEDERAEELCEQALEVARATGDPETVSGQLNYLADVYSARKDHQRALTAHEEALSLRRGLDDAYLVANSTYNLGIAAFENGEVDRAQTAFQETHALAQELGDVIHTAAADFMLAELDLIAGEIDSAVERIVHCLAVYTELENTRSRAECLVLLGGVAVARGSFDDAARLFGAADRLRGDSPLNRFEEPVLERYGSELEEALGPERLDTLKAEGARRKDETLTAPVVSRAVRH
jgi:predicted ATPase/DNA-binding SARP family transcriptional activator